MQCWREKKLSLLSVKKEILPLQAVRPWALVETSSSWWKTGCSVKEWEVSSSLFCLTPYSESGQNRERVKGWVDVIWTPGNKQHSLALSRQAESTLTCQLWARAQAAQLGAALWSQTLHYHLFLLFWGQGLLSCLNRSTWFALCSNSHRAAWAMPNHRRKPVLLPAPGTPQEMGNSLPELQWTLQSTSPHNHSPVASSSSHSVWWGCHWEFQAVRQPKGSDWNPQLLCQGQAALPNPVFPLPFLTAARFQLHPAALSQALQAHGALLLHGYNSQPYTQTGLVFNFLINTLYIKEKGLQFAVSTQRARGKRKKKKEKD